MKTFNQVSFINGDNSAALSALHSLLPRDLREWIDARELLAAVYEAAQTFYWTSQSPEAGSANSKGNPPVLLTVLTFCYATGNLATTEVERRINTDHTVDLLCVGRHFNRRTIQLFRSHHSELIKRCFAHVARRAWLGKFGALGTVPVQNTNYETSLRRLMIEEANVRIRQAVELDFHTPLVKLSQQTKELQTTAA